MSFSMYTASVPVIAHVLGNLSALIDKAAADCAARDIEPEVLINARLAPDMLPFSALEIQIASDVTKGGISRLAGTTPPSFPDEEVTFADLKERLAKTIAHVKSFTPAQIDGSEDKEIVLKFGPKEMKFTGSDYLNKFVLPNLYFHVSMAYAILRHNGVKIGKADFLGG